MVKHRLLFGTLMAALFIAIVIADGWFDGSLTTMPDDDKSVQGTVFCALIALLVIPAQKEFSKLASAKGLRIFPPITIIASILFATARYWPQIFDFHLQTFLLLLSAFSLLSLVLYQYLTCGNSSMLANCGANFFSIGYLGLLSSFCVIIRIEFGLWHLLMFVLVVKFADIGAYAIGSIFGKHKFSPRISPGKTWEGMGGAIGAAILVAVGFALGFGIMSFLPAIVFGLCFAFIGQLGDLVESMMKRDAEKKDSGSKVPGFGGVLDIIDSPLVAAPFAYLFFLCFS